MVTGQLERELAGSVKGYGNGTYTSEDLRKMRANLRRIRSVYAHAKKLGLSEAEDLTGIFPKGTVEGIGVLEKKLRADAVAAVGRADELSELMDDIREPINGPATRKRYGFNDIMKGLNIPRPIAARIFSSYHQETINQTQYNQLKEYVIISDPKKRAALARSAGVSLAYVRRMTKTLLRKGLLVNLGNTKKKSKAYGFLPKNAEKIRAVLAGE